MQNNIDGGPKVLLSPLLGFYDIYFSKELNVPHTECRLLDVIQMLIKPTVCNQIHNITFFMYSFKG